MSPTERTTEERIRAFVELASKPGSALFMHPDDMTEFGGLLASLGCVPAERGKTAPIGAAIPIYPNVFLPRGQVFTASAGLMGRAVPDPFRWEWKDEPHYGRP